MNNISDTDTLLADNPKWTLAALELELGERMGRAVRLVDAGETIFEGSLADFAREANPWDLDTATLFERGWVMLGGGAAGAFRLELA